MSFPITPSNIKGLSTLSQMPLRTDKTGTVEKQDIFNFLNQGTNTLQLTGQYSQFVLGAISSTPYYLSLVKFPLSSQYFGCNLRAFFTLEDSSLNTFFGDYLFQLHGAQGQVSITMSCINISGSASFTLFPSFGFYVETGYKEFGLEINTPVTARASNFVTLYMDAPSVYDKAVETQIPILQTSQAAMLSSPTVSLATNNGTNWYSWASTSSNSGGTTNGYV